MTSIISTPTFSLTYLEAVRDVQYQAVAAFTLMVWNFFLTFGEETEYVWQMRRCVFKWYYFYFRYFLLAAQIFHLAVSPSLSSGRVPDFLCLIWYRYIIFILQLSTSMIDIILATRVFALFDRNYRAGVFLVGLVLLSTGLASTHIAKCRMTMYFETCMLPRPPNYIAEAHTAVVMVVRSTLIGLIVYKHSTRNRFGRRGAFLLSFLVRDATSSYIFIFLLCVMALTICGLDDRRSIAIFYWSISLFSTIGCRLVVNMERFAREYFPDEEILLTSHITL